MIQNPVCAFSILFKLLSGSTEIDIIQLNGNNGREKIYSGSVHDSLKGLTTHSPSIDYDALVIPYNGLYNNHITGKLEIEVWNLEELEAAYYEEI